MELILYYAVSKNGKGILFEDMPERDEHFGIWKGTTNGRLASLLTYLEDRGAALPNLSFKDNPETITISISL